MGISLRSRYGVITSVSAILFILSLAFVTALSSSSVGSSNLTTITHTKTVFKTITRYRTSTTTLYVGSGCYSGEHWTSVGIDASLINPGLSFCVMFISGGSGVTVSGHAPVVDGGFQLNIAISSDKPEVMSYCIDNTSESAICTDSGNFTGTSVSWRAISPYVSYSVVPPHNGSGDYGTVSVSFQSCDMPNCYN